MASKDFKISPRLKGFVPLPSDPKVPLTSEQLKALFPHPDVWFEFMAETMRKNNITGIEPETPPTEDINDSDDV